MFEGGLSDFQTLELVSCVLCFACFVYGAQRPVWCSASGALCVLCLQLVAVLIVEEECPSIRDRSALLLIFLGPSLCSMRRLRYGSEEVSPAYYVA
jgi:hypothetical protein